MPPLFIAPKNGIDELKQYLKNCDPETLFDLLKSNNTILVFYTAGPTLSDPIKIFVKMQFFTWQHLADFIKAVDPWLYTNYCLELSIWQNDLPMGE
jgi:hypothetical protein